MRKTKSFPLLAAVVAATALAATVVGGAGSAKSTRATAGISCSRRSTSECSRPSRVVQASSARSSSRWAKYAVKTLPPTMGLKVKLVPGRCAGRAGPGGRAGGRPEVHRRQEHGRRARRLDLRLGRRDEQGAHSRPASCRSRRRPRARRSRRATTRRRRSAFFRVVPADDYQGPTDAKYMINTLKVKNVVRLRLPGALFAGSRRRGREGAEGSRRDGRHQSVPNTVTDFSSYVTKVPSDADIVFFPTQKPGDAQTFASQLAEQGKKAKVFGGDGSNGLGDVQGGRLVRLELRAADHEHRGRQGRSSPAGRRTTRARPSAPSARRPTAPSRSSSRPSRRPAPRARARSRSARALISSPSRRSPSTRAGSSAASSRGRRSTRATPTTRKFYIMQIQPNGSYKLVD